VANGSEDIEVVATVDILRRGGIDVKLCSVENNDKAPLTCANNIQIVPDLHVDDVQGQKFDVVIVPGGKYDSYKAKQKQFFCFIFIFR
jgi:putative intracellular protease/amidase